MHLPGEPLVAIVVVARAGMRAARLVAGTGAAVFLAGGLGMAVTMRLARRFLVGGQGAGLRGHGRGGRFLGLAAFGFLGLALGLLGFLGATLVGLGKRLLLGEVTLLGLLQLAQDLGALVVRIVRAAVLARAHQGHLLAHHHVDRGAAHAAPHRELLLAAAAQGDLLRRSFLGRLFSLAVGAAQEPEQLDLLGAGDHLVGVAELHAGLGQLFQQLLDRGVHQCGQLANGGLLRHSVSVSWGAGLGPCVGGAL